MFAFSSSSRVLNDCDKFFAFTDSFFSDSISRCSFALSFRSALFCLLSSRISSFSVFFSLENFDKVLFWLSTFSLSLLTDSCKGTVLCERVVRSRLACSRSFNTLSPSDSCASSEYPNAFDKVSVSPRLSSVI